jgi:hypothetical protein
MRRILFTSWIALGFAGSFLCGISVADEQAQVSALLRACKSDSGPGFTPQVSLAHQSSSIAEKIAPCPPDPQCNPALGAGDCALVHRYQAALTKLTAQGKVPPQRIADVIAPRFIEPGDWAAAKAKGITDPTRVYQPAPQTWQAWELARKLVDDKAATNVAQGHVSPMTLKDLLAIHDAAIGDQLGAGGIRVRDEMGMAIDRADATPASDLPAIRHFEYKSLKDPKEPLIHWTPKQCEEDWNVPADQILTFPVNTDKLPNLKSPDQTFIDKDGIAKQCGYFDYAPIAEVRQQLASWEADMNRGIATWKSGASQASRRDPLLVAARAQRWLVSIHPFTKGNGRTSRLVLDELVESLGLPAPVLKDPERDLGTFEKDWANEIRAGVTRSVEILEHCALPENAQEPGCQIVKP